MCAMPTIDPSRLAAILAKHRLNQLTPVLPPTVLELASWTREPSTEYNFLDPAIQAAVNVHEPVPSALAWNQGIGRTGEIITYNDKQMEAITRGGRNGESIVLIGAAGSGKTTCQQGIVTELIQSGKAGVLRADGHKYLQTGTPGIVVIAYTRRATNNIRKFMPEDMKDNCLTFHKLMEYEPVFYETLDPLTNRMIKTMRFEPTRNFIRPLPSSIHTVVIEEGSMFSKEYYEELRDALPHEVQFIFLGDIQQLPPVFGSAILGYKMLELPVIELTEIYRQALESPIIRLAHRILSGKPIPAMEYADWKVPGKLTIHPWKKKLSADVGLLTAASFFTGAIEAGIYDPEQDIILLPFNKSFGTDDLNRHIAGFIAKKQSRIVYEIIAGFDKLYLAVGDKVMFEKEDAMVVSIEPNLAYGGRAPQAPSTTMDYFGHEQGTAEQQAAKAAMSEQEQEDAASLYNIDFLMAQAANSSDEDRVRQASHIVTLRRAESDIEYSLETAGELNAIVLGYALTVHKSQGSEWRKVYCVFHQSHATMLQRELLYTAITRAKEELYVICEPETFTNGIISQRIKGDTLAEKAIYFQGKVDEQVRQKELNPQ